MAVRRYEQTAMTARQCAQLALGMRSLNAHRAERDNQCIRLAYTGLTSPLGYYTVQAVEHVYGTLRLTRFHCLQGAQLPGSDALGVKHVLLSRYAEIPGTPKTFILPKQAAELRSEVTLPGSHVSEVLFQILSSVN